LVGMLFRGEALIFDLKGRALPDETDLPFYF
jgi:hypothetical protein